MKFPAGKLIPLQTPIDNGALSGDKLPTRLKLLNWGRNETKKGPVTVGSDTLSGLSAAQTQYGFDRIALDYAHNSLPGHPNFKADPREVAAYGVPQVVEGEGLFLDAIQWTPSGQKFAPNYADLSPTPLLNEAGEVIFLHSVALCPQGAVEGLSFYDAPVPAVPASARSMNPELAKLLAAIFGTPEDASLEQLIEAGKAFLDKKAKEPEKKDDPSDLQALSARLDAVERGNLLALAAGEGKVIAKALHDLPLEKLKALIAETPVTVPLEKRTAPGVVLLSVDAPAMSDQDRAVAKQLGLSEADYKSK